MTFTTEKIYYAYMVAVGIVAGAVLMAFPQAANWTLGPFLWVLIGVGLFDAGLFATGRAPATALTMNTRVIGFVIGLALMLTAKLMAGTPAA